VTSCVVDEYSVHCTISVVALIAHSLLRCRKRLSSDDYLGRVVSDPECDENGTRTSLVGVRFMMSMNEHLFPNHVYIFHSYTMQVTYVNSYPLIIKRGLKLSLGLN
jgi:hypothetical protein